MSGRWGSFLFPESSKHFVRVLLEERKHRHSLRRNGLRECVDVSLIAGGAWFAKQRHAVPDVDRVGCSHILSECSVHRFTTTRLRARKLPPFHLSSEIGQVERVYSTAIE